MAESYEDDDDSPLTVADFHTVAQKQILNAVFATLAESKMSWNLVEPFLETGRAVCIGDFTENARIRIHTQRAEGEAWVEAAKKLGGELSESTLRIALVPAGFSRQLFRV